MAKTLLTHFSLKPAVKSVGIQYFTEKNLVISYPLRNRYYLD